MSDDLSTRLASLERLARRLEPDDHLREHLTRAASAYAEEFVTTLPSAPGFVPDEHDATARPEAVSENPRSIASFFQTLATSIDTVGINPASGRHLGYIPGGGVYASAWGDFLADITNRYAGVFYASPGAVRLENDLLAWLATVVGFPSTAVGNLTSGGSLASLIAIVTAREAAGLTCATIPTAVVYRSEHAHHCLDKALRIAGLNEVVLRELPLDDQYRVCPERTSALIAEDRAAGLRPWLLIGSAGTTDTGSIDPLDALATIAASEKLWYHVDGAYGAFFALTETGRSRLRGMERADSLVLDPHKTLFLPYGSGVVLVRDPTHLARAHRYQANYMQDADRASDVRSPAELSPELTKPFRGLRLWLPLWLHGVGAFRAALDEKLLLAQYAYRRLGEIGFERGPEPELSVVTYRWRPRTRHDGRPIDDETEIDAFNRRLHDSLLRDGRVFISSTLLRGRYTLRFAIVVHRTHRSDMDLALELLEAEVRRLEAARFSGCTESGHPLASGS